jgi:hypothetical protein
MMTLLTRMPANRSDHAEDGFKEEDTTGIGAGMLLYDPPPLSPLAAWP